MPYTVEIAPAAERQLRKLDTTVRRRIFVKLDSLKKNPRPPGVEKLWADENLYRGRAGDYRIVYEIDDRITRVLVLKVGDRKEIYKG